MSKDNSMQEILRDISKNLGQSPDEIRNSAESGNVDSLLKKLPKEQRDKVNSILQNPEETRKILENPQVQALIRKLKDNG
ncbi:MAG: hypothetical protein Q4D44_02470 [Eubacteriales bacterium]|nr:hypothetical protein [Eubacteriales bacterium]